MLCMTFSTDKTTISRKGVVRNDIKLATLIPVAPPLATKTKIDMGVQEVGVHLCRKRVNLKVAPALVAPLTNEDASS